MLRCNTSDGIREVDLDLVSPLELLCFEWDSVECVLHGVGVALRRAALAEYS